MTVAVLLFALWSGAVWVGREDRWVTVVGAIAVGLMTFGLYLLWGAINE